MYFKQFYEPRLAQYSYLIGCQATGEALVIDPLRDIHPYIQQAQDQGLRITHITETHIHADFLSGARALAQATGAQLLLSDQGGPAWQYAFPHQGLRDGDIFQVGGLRIQVLHTPGHTPEHLSFLLTDAAASDSPAMLFTGDFLLVGDVGRPDLLELVDEASESSRSLAQRLFASLQRIRTLPDHLLVWPGHGAGSACGKAIGALPVTTLGYEKRTNWALQETSEEAFILKLLADLPPAPSYFPRMKTLNRAGPDPTSEPTYPHRLTLHQLDAWLQQGAILVDTRDKLAFAEGYIPGSLHIPGSRMFTTWAGWTLSPHQPIILLVPEDQVQDLILALYHIGLDHVVGYLPDVHLWVRDGRSLAQLHAVPAQDLAAGIQAKTMIPVDIRNPHELATGFIPGAIFAPAARLFARTRPPDTPRRLVLYCNAGDRAMIVASYLRLRGFPRVDILFEGIEGWKAAGLPLETPEHHPGFENVDVETAYQLMQQGWTLVDVRSEGDVRRGYIPGALAIPLDDFIHDATMATLRQHQPLLLICNTGNRSAMAAEWLLEEGVTRIANVAGGVVAWQIHHLPWQRT